MPDMKELLPCPFCGGKANIENEGTQADITCEDCYASNNIQICDHFTYEERHNNPDFKWLDAPIYGYAHKGKQRAINTLTKYWNTRAPSKQLTETQQALDRAVEALQFTDSAIMQLKEIPEITKLHVDKWCLDGRAYLKAALASIKEGA